MERRRDYGMRGNKPLLAVDPASDYLRSWGWELIEESKLSATVLLASTVCFSMVSYDSDSSAENPDDYATTNVLLGYASKEPTDDPISQLGGRPVCFQVHVHQAIGLTLMVGIGMAKFLSCSKSFTGEVQSLQKHHDTLTATPR